MKTLLRLAFVLFALPFWLQAGAQSWSLVSAVKTQSSIKSVFMTSPSTGFALDDLDDRLLRTRNGGQSWHRQGLAFSLTPQTIWMFNDSVGLIGTSTGTFYKSTDGFNTRVSVSTTSGSTKALYFINSSTGFAIANNTNIKKTTDGGSTWSIINTGNTNILFGLYFLDATTGFACGTSGTILRTVDGGATWQALTTGYTYNFNDVYFLNSSVGIAVGSGGYITRTTDGGNTWTAVTTPTTQNLYDLNYSNNTLFAVGEGGVLLRSANGGLSWTSSSLGTNVLYTMHINTLGFGLVGGDGAIYKTNDFGVTWTPSQIGLPHSVLNKVSFANDLVGIAVGWQTTNGMQNALVRTDDGGKTWTGRNLSTGTLGVHLRADGNGVIGGSSGYNERTTNYGQTFTPAVRPQVAVRAVWSQNATTYIMGGGYVNGGIYRTTNGGGTWNYTAGGNIYEIYFPSDLVGYAGGEGGALMKTVNGGSTWTNINSGTTSDINSIFFINDTLGYVAGISGAFRTSNGGSSWTPVNGVGNVYAIHFYTSDSGYAVTGTGDLLKTVNAGNSWSLVAAGNIPDMLIKDAAFLNGKVIAVGTLGDIYVTNLTCANAALTPQVIRSGNTLYSTFASGNQWYNGSGAVAGATGSTYQPAIPGTYYVINTTAQGCPSAASNSITVVATGVSALDEEGALRVYPNPTKGLVKVEVPLQLRTKPVALRNAAGQLVFSKRGANASLLSIDLSQLPAGVYYLSVGDKVSKIINNK
jgi:photosystem II stability/assembly factor-like uncharacterized protein